MIEAPRMQRPYREIGKSLAWRTVEFVRALQLIRDALDFLRIGQIRYLATLSGQLRALLTDPSAKTKPLLLDIADVLGAPLRAFCMPDVNDSDFPDELKDDLLFHLSGFPITAERQFEAQVEVSFSELLDREVLLFKGNRYSARTIIEWFANKAGGAHYATRVPEDFAELFGADGVGAKALVDAMVHLGAATFDAGRNLLKSIVDLEIHTIICVPQAVPVWRARTHALEPMNRPPTRIFLNPSLMSRLMGSWAALPQTDAGH